MDSNYEENVFINCPFDIDYASNFQAITFTVYRCGFFPVSALSEDNALHNRLSKIEKIIETSKYGIHDISRTELNSSGLPRFNMPFELGVFFGAKKYGNKYQKRKNALTVPVIAGMEAKTTPPLQTHSGVTQILPAHVPNR